MSIDAGLVAGIIKSQTAPTELSVLWAKVLNPSFPNTTVLHRYNFVTSTWVKVEDAIIKNPIITFQLDTPPGSPSEGDAYIIGNAPTGVWAGRAKDHALYLGGQWNYTTPKNGSFCSQATGGGENIYVFNVSLNDWALYSPSPLTGTNTNTVRFDVSGDLVESAVLKNDGTDIEIVNKLKLGGKVEQNKATGIAIDNLLNTAVLEWLANNGLYIQNGSSYAGAEDGGASIGNGNNLVAVDSSGNIKLSSNALANAIILAFPNLGAGQTVTQEYQAQNGVISNEIEVYNINTTSTVLGGGSTIINGASYALPEDGTWIAEWSGSMDCPDDDAGQCGLYLNGTIINGSNREFGAIVSGGGSVDAMLPTHTRTVQFVGTTGQTITAQGQSNVGSVTALTDGNFVVKQIKR